MAAPIMATTPPDMATILLVFKSNLIPYLSLILYHLRSEYSQDEPISCALG
jgi:hypothetical protein